MKLYLISQYHNNDYDTYDSAIVAAENEDEARNINPDKYQVDSWCDLQYVRVKYIGIADKSLLKGIVLASFNAG